MRKLLKIGGALLLVGLVLEWRSAAILIHSFIQTHTDRCAHDERMISQDANGNSIWSTEVICDEVAHSDVITLTLKRQRSSSADFFSYSPSYVPDIAEPRISWITPNALSVEIARVEEVYAKHEKADGMAIRYKIDRVEIADDHF